MLPKLWMSFYAVLAVFLAAPVHGGTLYSIYQGGAGGILELQWTTPAPIQPGETFVSPNHAFLVYPKSPLFGAQFGWNATLDEKGLGIHTGLNFVTATFLDAPVTSTADGAYSLVPFSIGSKSWELHGSFIQIGVPDITSFPQNTIPIDTLVLATVGTPEPATLLMFAIGCTGLLALRGAGYWIRTR